MIARRQILLPFLLTSKSKYKMSLLIAKLNLSLNWAVSHWLRLHAKKMEGNKRFLAKGGRLSLPLAPGSKATTYSSRITEIMLSKENQVARALDYLRGF